jgi:hypothetical protein
VSDFLLDSHAWIVTDASVHAAKGIEKATFAGVWVADQCNNTSIIRGAIRLHELSHLANENSNRFAFSQADPIPSDSEFGGVTHRSSADHRNWLVFDKPHFHKSARDDIIAGNFDDDSRLTRLESVQTDIGESHLTSGWNYENVGRLAKPQTNSAAFDANQARFTLANHANFAPLANSQLRQTLHLARLSAHLHDGAVTFGLQIFNWEGNRVSNHGTTDWKDFELVKPHRFRKLISTINWFGNERYVC